MDKEKLTLKSHLKKLNEVVLDDNLPEPLSTGYDQIDIVLGGGFYPHRLYVVGAGTGKGKTAFGQNLTLNINKTGKKGLLFSLEMTGEQLLIRYAQMMTGHGFNEIYNRKYIKDNEINSKEVIGAINKAFDKINNNIYIYDEFDTEIEQIEEHIKKLQQELKIEYVIIDYLGLVSVNENTSGAGNKVQELSHITRQIKKMSKKLALPLIILSQLSREGQKDNIIPELYHLRDSGSIENDADVVILLNCLKENEGDKVNLYSLNIAKNRFGYSANIPMMFLKRRTTFSQIEDKERREEAKKLIKGKKGK